jgi:hypothetical protein
VYLVILLAAAAILVGVVVVAMGRGGEMALFVPDRPVRIIRLETPGDVATMYLPLGLVGYQARATGEALVAAANLLARRDAEIAALRREVWRLGGDDQLVVPGAEAGAPAGSDGVAAADEGAAGGGELGGGVSGLVDEEAPVDQGGRQERADQAGQP